MKKWLRKALVVSFSILTLGLVAPPPALTMEQTDADKPSKLNAFNEQDNESKLYSNYEYDYGYDSRDFVTYAMTQAETKSFEKFGSKIGPVIEDEFRTQILPQIERVIELLAEQYPAEQLNQLEISEQPSGGNGEKIFHIFDKTNGKDIVRFHVRKDHPPLDGYYFNFHYHTHHDGFQTHHTLGDIYWDKNTPPKWLS
ncbi:YpjP family protein [Bacillus sinesaloumensis]|uniref:YpjP family protein n=1 Tax=Litchfieldia sinesaloumensis TaxID=1926280 RepID=UPI0009885B57|nr:YpjP family protein [Bacillus sinesaloumensis]